MNSHSCIVFFFAVDIQDSTRLKQKLTTGPGYLQPWWPLMGNFFTELPDRVKEAWERRNGTDTLGPVVWKGVGDEVILVKVVHSLDDISNAFEAASEGLSRFRGEFLNKARQLISSPRLTDNRPEVAQEKDGPTLVDLKSYAWTAGFPVENAAFTLPPDEDPLTTASRIDVEDWLGREKHVEFLGPKVDAGFRLGEFATSRRCVLSPELAYLLAKSCRTDSKLNFYCEGWKRLKGTQRAIPLFWLDQGKGKHPDNFGRERFPPSDVVREFDDYANQACEVVPPYILRTDGKYEPNDPPDWHLEALEDIAKKAEHDKTVRERTRDAVIGIDPPSEKGKPDPSRIARARRASEGIAVVVTHVQTRESLTASGLKIETKVLQVRESGSDVVHEGVRVARVPGLRSPAVGDRGVMVGGVFLPEDTSAT